MIARGALAKNLGGDNAALGLVTLAFGGTSLVLTPFGGVLADRLPKRRLMVVSTLLLASTSLALGITELLEATEFWMLVIVSSLQAAAFALLVPARMAFTAEIVGPDLIPNAVALAQISQNSNRVFGPAVAAAFLSVSWLDFAGIYLFGAVLSVLAVGCFLFLDAGVPPADRIRRAPLTEMANGVRYAASVPSLRVVVVLAVLVTMIGFPYVTFLPSVSEDFFGRGEQGFAILSLVGASGGVAAGVIVARTVLSKGPWLQTVSGVILAGGLGFLAVAPTFETAVLASVVVGGSTAGFQSMNATLALSFSDIEYHGRVQSMLQMGFGMFGLAAFPLGVLADEVGLRQTLGGMAVAVLLIIVSAEIIWRRDRAAEAIDAAR